MKTLKSIREANCMTQQDVAKHLDIPISTYVMYENGSRNIPKDIVDKLVVLLNIKNNNIFLPTRFTISK